MKLIKKYIVILLLPLIGLLHGCDVIDDKLNLDNIGAYDPGDIWDSEVTAQYYVNNSVARIVGGGWGNVGGWTDECGKYIPIDAITVDNGTQKNWNYENIRRLNQGLQDADDGNMAEIEKSRIKGQLYFLRAYAYFNMVMLHGGVPIIDHPQDRDDDDLYVFRNTTAECFDFIIEDLGRALDSDILDRAQGANYGMLSKAAVKAFKGRVLLYKASPLFNPANYWDNQYWQAAYNANKQAYDELSAMGFNLVPTYDDIFKSTKGQIDENDEYILMTILRHPDSNMGWRTRQIRPLSKSSGDTSWDQPAWDLIELYPMADGYQPGESPNYEYSVNTYFENRDPRFYRSITYNASETNYGGEFNRIYTTYDVQNVVYPGAWIDGVPPPDAIHRLWDRTGFFPKKQIMEENTLDQIHENDKDFPFIRFAEVILNLAEAANETGNQGEAVEMLKLIRDRAGIEPGNDGNYGIDNSSRESIRETIHNERAIEFIWEHKRYTDMRRWRRFHEWHNQPKHHLFARLKPEFWVEEEFELVPEKAGWYNLLPEDFTYEVYEHRSEPGLTVQSLPDKYYFSPIQLRHMELNPNLEQNIGWDNGTFDPTLP